MNLIDRYMNEVRSHLPRKGREDLETEIRSLIEDTLEDRSQTAERPVDEDMIVAVLKEFGPPEKIAAGYLPEQYLVGPRLFPSFLVTLRVVFTVLAILTLIGLGVELSRNDPTLLALGQTVLGTAAGFVSAVLQALGTIVLIFVVIQWALPQAETRAREWDPRKLKDTGPKDVVRPAKPVAEIVMSVVVLLALNVYPEWIGIANYSSGEWVFVPILSQAFFRLVPWINLILVIKMVESFLLLRRGSWTPASRWLSAAGSMLNIVLLITMLTGPALLALDPAATAALGWPEVTGMNLERVLNGILRLTLSIVLIVEAIELATTLYQIFKKKSDLLILEAR